MCYKFAKYIDQHTELSCCKKICGWLVFTIIVAVVTIGVLSATVYKDKWSIVWVNVIDAKCEPNCELESCPVTCDMYVSYKCKNNIVYMNFTSDVMDRTYSAGDKLKIDRNNDNCRLEIDGRTPLGNIFLYICIGGLGVLLLGMSVVGSITFIYRGSLEGEPNNLNDDETTPLKNVTVINYHSKNEHLEMPHIHF